MPTSGTRIRMSHDVIVVKCVWHMKSRIRSVAAMPQIHVQVNVLAF